MEHYSPYCRLMPNTPSTRERILELIRKDPTLRQPEIARLVGVSQQRVSQILDEEGLQRKWVKSPEPQEAQ